MNNATFTKAWVLAFSIATTALYGDPTRVEVVRCVDIPNVRDGTHSISCTLQLSGEDAKDVVGGRAIVDVATDDRGNALKQRGEPKFQYDAVGSVAGDSSETTSSRPLEVVLSPLHPGMKQLQQLRGRLELFIPKADPDSTIVIDAPESHLGVPIESAALRSVGISFVVSDKAGIRANDYAALTQGAELPKELLEVAMRDVKLAVDTMPETEVIAIVSDPDEKLYSVEFQHKDGTPLRYNHNGNFHFGGGGSSGRALHGFDLRQPMADDVRLVVRVITPRSIRVLPFAISDIPLQLKPQTE